MFKKKYITKYNFLYKIYLIFFYIRYKFFIKKTSYSQFEEDLTINYFFKDFVGKYVDIGCYHPIKFNNTLLLYNRGWKGVNIDLNPTSIDLFNMVRNEDLNINACLSDKEEEVTIFFDNEFSALNSIYSSNVEKFQIKNYKKIKTKTKIFSDLVKDNFDFLNIDCEGNDLKILKSINLSIYTPKLICIEAGLENDTGAIYKYLSFNGYELLEVKKESHIFKRIK